jgi:hypothetical protein
MSNPKTTPTTPATAPYPIAAILALQHHTNTRLQKVEETSHMLAKTQKQLNEKLDGIYNLLTQWNSSSEMGSAPRTHRQIHPSVSPSPNHQTLTLEELAPEAFTFTLNPHTPHTTPGFVYTY